MISQFPAALEFGDTIGLLSQGTLTYFKTRFKEPMPPGDQNIIDFGSLAAGAASSKAVSATLQLDEGFLVQLRMACIDDCDLQVWEQGGTPRFWTRGLQSRVTRQTRLFDPTAETTEFWIVGYNRDAQFVCLNPRGSTSPANRVMFWGWKYLLQAVMVDENNPAPDPACVKWVVADGNAGNIAAP